MSVIARAGRAWALLRELLRADTANPPGDESSASEILGDFLSDEGLSAVRLDDEPGRANLLARVPGERPGVLLTGSMDVPPPGKGWSHPPFGGVEENGFLYGPGALGDKAFLAMAAVAFAEASRRRLSRELILAAVADREGGGRCGARFLAQAHPEFLKADYMLGWSGCFAQSLGKLRLLPIGTAQKGRLDLRLRFRGAGGGGGTHQPKAAAFMAAKALSRLIGGLPLRGCGASRVFLKEAGLRSGWRGLPMWALTSQSLAPAALALMSEERSGRMRALLSATATPVRFEGSGVDALTMDLSLRTLPGRSREQSLSELWRVLGGEVEHEVLGEVPSVESSHRTPFFRHLAESVRRVFPGHEPVPCLGLHATDAAFFSRLGMECYGMSPLLFEDRDLAELPARAGGPDERVHGESFYKGYALLEESVLGFVEKKGAAAG